MFQLKSLSFLIISTLLAFTLWSCDSDPVSTDTEEELEEPSPPSLEQINLDFSVFEGAENFNSMNYGAAKSDRSAGFSGGDLSIASAENEMSLSSSENGFEMAASYAGFVESYFSSMAELPQAFFQQGPWGEGTYEDNVWTWEYTWPYEDESLSLRITSEDTGDAMEWELRYSYSGEEEENFENALLIAAQVNHDESGGAWQLFDLFKQDNPALEFVYEVEDDMATLVDLTFSENESRILYERDEEISFLQLWNLSSEHTLIEWSNETGVGFIESTDFQDSQRVCWNEDSEYAEC